MGSLPRKLLIYIGVLFLGAVIAMASTAPQLISSDWTSFILFAALAILADLIQIQTANGTYVSLSFTIIMVTLATCGMPVGIWVSVLAAVSADLIRRKDGFKIVFNGSQFALMAWFAGIVMQQLSGGYSFRDISETLFGIFFVGSLIGALVNVGLTSVPIAIMNNKKVSRVFGEVLQSILPVFPVQVILGFMLSYTYVTGNYHWFALLLTVLGLVFHSYLVNRRMLDTARVTNTVLESVNVGIITVNERGKVVMINSPACQLLQVDHVQGHEFSEVFPQRQMDILMETLHHGQIFNDYEVEMDDGKFFRLQTAQLKESSRITGAIIFIQDITERRQWEEQIRQAEKLSIVGELAAGTAHELRNPLTAVKGFIQLLRGKCLEHGFSKEATYTEIVLEEIERINIIISEFLSLSKPLQPDLRIIDIRSIIADLTVLMDSEALLRNVEFETQMVEDLPLLVVEIDQIKQVFLNLISNAFAAMPEGGRLKIIGTYDADEGMVVLDFNDSGVGIAPEVQARVFEPFFTTKEDGTGLGLTVTYRIVQNHGGQIGVLSNPGQGTTFRVKLPVQNNK